MIAYLLILSVPLTIFAIVYTYLSYRNKERLALINAGLDPTAFTKIAPGKLLLVLGFVFLGFSLGIIAGFFLEKYLSINDAGHRRYYPQAYLSMITLCLGIAMVISFYVTRRMERR